MPKTPLPEGMTEHDYEMIQAAVMETVRGRWFLDEFARRTRMGEIHQMVEAVGRLERVVMSGHQPALSAPDSLQMRLMAQRTAEISEQIGRMARDFRARGQEEAICAGLEAQARAVAGLIHGRPTEAQALPEPSPAVTPASGEAGPQLALSCGIDPRLEALAVLDHLPFAEKLALFS
jgi:hypothetical protein